MKFRIDNMVCGGCTRSVTRAIQTVDPDAHVVADLPSHTVEVTTCASAEKIIEALREAEFPPVLL